MMNKIKLLFCYFLFLPTLSFAFPPEFTATYNAEAFGMTVARATYKLKHNGKGLTFSQHSKPTGFAAIISDVELNETSYLSLHNDQLLLDKYHYIQKDEKKDRDIHLKIEWDNTSEGKSTGIVSGIARGDLIQFKVNSPVWDTLSFQIPIMMTPNKKTASPQSVLVKGKLEAFSFITHGNEDITIGDNTIKTVKIEMKGDDESKPLFLWIAPSLHNLPIKIEKWKKGKPHITMLLDSATFPADKNTKFEIKEDFNDL